ncbi:MAG: hypothetical protein IPK07_18335 [Deltaproteobacteria bacterium]|nr:hypothetical protein [Deltaproteobacteria bacterium]
MNRHVLRRVLVVAAAALLPMAVGASRAAAQECNPTTGSAPQSVILGPNGEQFYPQNTACPDQVVAPECEGGFTLHWKDPEDPNGLMRYACVASAPSTKPLPLVVFLHPSRVDTVDETFGGKPGGLPDTNLLPSASTAKINPKLTGYVLLMPQGRCLTAPPTSSGNGVRFDVWYKDAQRNLDVRAVQQFVAQLVSRKTLDANGNPQDVPATVATVDVTREYLMGWSDGVYLAHFLALSFPTQFAAVATFAGADPFSRGPCPTPYPKVSRKPPVMVVHSSCDPIELCANVEGWFQALSGQGWPASALSDVITDTTHTQLQKACSQDSNVQQRSCPLAAHFVYANPQLPAMFQWLGKSTAKGR